MHPLLMLSYWARISPERPALIQSNMVITHGALEQAVAACAARIHACGFDREKPVAVAIPDPAKLLAVCLALLRNGIACAPVAHNIVPSLVANGVTDLIFAPGSQALPDGNNVGFDDSWLRSSGMPAATTADPIPATNMIFFTSGTTGTPKKVVLPAAALVARVTLANAVGDTRFNKVLMGPGPTTTFGFTRLAALLAAGKTIVFAGDVSYPLKLIETFKVDAIIASPQQVLALVEMIEADPGYRLDSVREIRIGGSALSADLARRVQSLLCRSIVTEYGATETGLVALAPYETIRGTPGAVGFVLPGICIEIVDENHQPVPAGEEGLIRGRSDSIQAVFEANLGGGADENKEAWWYPGDFGRLTERGILCIGGRSDDVINSGGVKVSAVVLDQLVCSFPGVRDAGVCAGGGGAGIDEIWIGLASDADIDLAALKQFVEASQNFQLRVGPVIRIEKIPRNDLGKLQRHELKALLVASDGGQAGADATAADSNQHSTRA
ncbi:MAG: AMP-binding protein [Rhizobiales bacterium]|nr:AMP-binding protein [Hyphomicrobiales bacterium]